jgi:mannose/fructose-specific phosphotransferase system component IIA
MAETRRKIACVIVGHGNLGECLMDAVQSILGKQTGWVAVSNRGLGLKELNEAVGKAVDGLAATCDVVVFSDMPGGSCHHACQELTSERPRVRAITGANLMMLLEFFVKRDRVPLEDLLLLIRERGKDAVRFI